MSEDAGDKHDEEMESAVQLRRQREEFWRRTGERSLWQNVSMIGALGWLIVTPTLLGVLIGRWLDVRFGTGIFWSGALDHAGRGVRRLSRLAEDREGMTQVAATSWLWPSPAARSRASPSGSSTSRCCGARSPVM